MFSFADLDLPLIAAPMAGGPSTPALVAAAASAGGLGFLAAGYLTPDALAAQIHQVREASGRPFGVNLFVPEAPAGDPLLDAELARFADALRPLAARLGTEPGTPRPDDDGWAAKLDLVVAERVPVVSTTFGLPPQDAVQRLHAAGCCVVATVASVADARAAASRGVDALVVQGVEAGGHRATLAASAEPDGRGALDLLSDVRECGLPVVAAGGFATVEGVDAALRAGAQAVQVGTALLLSPEAGTNPSHRAALTSPAYPETAVTRVFTGRPARSLVNAFVRDAPQPPPAYPAVHQITSPLRKAAAATGDAEHLHLWAGTGWRSARAEPASEILRRLGGR